MNINWAKYLPTAVDVGERLVRDFASGFVVGSGLLGAAVSSATGQLAIGATQINWAHGLDFGAGTMTVDIVVSLAALKIGNPGAALNRFVSARWPSIQQQSADTQQDSGTATGTAAQ